ncbi:MAG: hypothetical protein K2W95_30810 [Candidatus Obscuribacterales bacterium]|nr:hypothetical protein [Candidatus Obscuribacterales bacterium]
MQNRRKASGSVIVEGTCGVMLLIAVIVPLLLFCANVTIQLILQAKVSHIANQSAQIADEGKYWLGVPRPGYDQRIASDKATAVASAMCKQMGLPDASVVVAFDDRNPDFDITVCDLNVNAVGSIPFRLTIFNFDLARLFPGNVSARGVAAHAKIKPYALVHMDAPHRIDQSTRTPLGFNERDVAVLPAYGFFYQAVAGNSSVPQTPYGKGLAPNLTPENFFALNHYHLKKSDIEYVVKTGQDVQLSGWHKDRRIDNRSVSF